MITTVHGDLYELSGGEQRPLRFEFTETIRIPYKLHSTAQEPLTESLHWHARLPPRALEHLSLYRSPVSFEEKEARKALPALPRDARGACKGLYVHLFSI